MFFSIGVCTLLFCGFLSNGIRFSSLISLLLSLVCLLPILSLLPVCSTIHHILVGVDGCLPSFVLMIIHAMDALLACLSVAVVDMLYESNARVLQVIDVCIIVF